MSKKSFRTTTRLTKCNVMGGDNTNGGALVGTESTASAPSSSASASASSSPSVKATAKGEAKDTGEGADSEEASKSSPLEPRFFDGKDEESRELPDAKKTITPCGLYDRTFFGWIFPLISFAFHNGQLQMEE